MLLLPRRGGCLTCQFTNSSQVFLGSFSWLESLAAREGPPLLLVIPTLSSRVLDFCKLWLHLPDDPGIFTETQSRGELTLTTDAQIYLDLQSTGLRGPDAAAALLEWDGFCRP
jgi:hypothetical protein